MINQSIIEKVYTKKSIAKVTKKVTLLGINEKINVIDFMNMRLIISLILFFVILFFNSLSFIYSPVVTLLFYFGVEYLLLDVRIKKRISKLDNDALFFFEVLTLSLETGRNLKGAIEITCNNIDNDLSDEFKETLNQLNYGKTLNEALNDMKKRIPSDAVNNVLLNITQSNIFGSSIIDTLYNQVDYLRDKKLLSARAKIARMPIKMSIISVVFFIPLILLLILGPILITMLL